MCDPGDLSIGKRMARPLTRRFAPTSSCQERGEVKKAATAVLTILATVLALNSSASYSVAQTTTPVDLTILAINDFHGNLRPPAGGIGSPIRPTGCKELPAGGAERLCHAGQAAARQAAQHDFVAAGDLVGASPLLSALFHDEPTMEALSHMGLDMATVGNHEFDDGKDELLRLQNGGCHPAGRCHGSANLFASGAAFATSPPTRSIGRPARRCFRLTKSDVRRRPGGVYGPCLEGTPDIVLPSGVAGLDFPRRGRHRQCSGAGTCRHRASRRSWC